MPVEPELVTVSSSVALSYILNPNLADSASPASQAAPGIPCVHSPSAEISGSSPSLTGIHMGSVKQTPFLILLWQSLHPLSHLLSPTFCFSSMRTSARTSSSQFPTMSAGAQVTEGPDWFCPLSDSSGLVSTSVPWPLPSHLSFSTCALSPVTCQLSNASRDHFFPFVFHIATVSGRCVHISSLVSAKKGMSEP